MKFKSLRQLIKPVIMVIFVAFVGEMSAQTALLPTVGVTASSIEDFEGAEFNSKAGYTVGLDLRTAGRFYIQPGLHYELLRNEVTQKLINSKGEFSVSRMRIPVKFGFRLFNQDIDRALNFRVYTGPVASIKLNADAQGDFQIPDSDFSSFLFAWNGGIGVDFLLFFADLGYNWGLSEVFDDIDGLEGEDATNSVFYLNAGVRIRF